MAGREKEAEKRAESLTKQAENQLDKAVGHSQREQRKQPILTAMQSKDAKSAFNDAEARAKEYKEKTGKELNQAIDKFDKTVEDKAAQAKSGISGWFGGGK